MLELHDLQVQLASSQVLRGFSLSVPQGQMVGLVGRNGAGKTSTMRSIMGHLRLQQGSMLFEGQDLCAYRRKPARLWESATCPKTADWCLN